MESQEENNKLYCESIHKLLHLKSISPAYGDSQFNNAIKSGAVVLAKFSKAKNQEDKLKTIKDFDEVIDPVFTENQIIFPLEPKTLAKHPKKGNLIAKHISVDTLDERIEKIKEGYVVLKEHTCNLTHSLTEWGNSWIP